MADGVFATLISKDRNDNALSNPIYIQLSDGTSAIGVTGGAIDVNIDNASIVVTATDLDIRDLDAAQDNVAISDGTDTLAVNYDGSINITDNGGSITVDGTVAVSSVAGTVTVDASDLDIRDLTKDSDSIQIWANTAKDGSGTDYVPLVDADGHLQIDVLTMPAISINAEKVDDSAFSIGSDYVSPAGFLADETAPDSVDEGDVGLARMTLDRKQLMVITDPSTDANRLGIDASGYITANINGTVTVDATDLDIRDLDANQDNVAISDGTDTLAVNYDGSINITDNGGSITVDGTVGISGTVTVQATDLDIRDLTHASDSVKVGDGTEFLAVNADGSINVNIVSSTITGEIHDFDQAGSVGAGSSSNHDYTVSNTMLLESVIVSASGNCKFEVQVGQLASLATVAVGFLNGRQGDTKQITFNPPVEIPATGTGTVRIIKTNRQLIAQDLYSTIIGIDA
jgi:hypothetical protein